MSAGLFSKALRGAGFAITTSKEGMRSFRDEHDDRTSEPSRGGKAPRGSWRGGQGNWRGTSRGNRGGRSRGGPRRRGGRDRNSRYSKYSSGGSQDDTIDEDGDVDMGDSGMRSNRRFSPYGSRPPYRQPGNKFQSSRQTGYQSDETWNKITIQNGKQHDKVWLLKRLQSFCKVSFEPVEFHFSHDHAHFFVDDQRSADALRAISGSITIRDGSKLFIQVRNCPPPTRTNSGTKAESTSVDQDVLKLSLNTRYDTTTHSLDLSNFYHDKVLMENQIQGALHRPWLMEMIVKLVKEYCPQLQTLDLRDNKLCNLDGLKNLNEAAPHISNLHIGGNNIRFISELRKIKNLKGLTILVTDGNPLCDNYNDSKTGYVSDIRSIFPKLVMLDNCKLPDHIGFDLPSSTSLPENKESFIPDDLKKTLVPFVQQKGSLVNQEHRLKYFQVYDSDNRQKLLDAYDDDAVFSMCVADYRKERANGSGPLNAYRKYSRNMKFLHDNARRLELLKTSRLSVVAFLNELPSTKHDLDSLTLDVSLVKPTCIGFTVCGVFKEGDIQELRAFSRAFLAVPAAGNSIAIINDQLSIRNPSQAQRELSNKSSTFQQMPTSETVSPFPAAATITAPQVPTPAGAGLTPQQQQMVDQFSKQSGMNMNWSFKALSENSWDYQKSADVFKSLQSQGSIPQEAFVK